MKYILANKKACPLPDICDTLFVRSVSFFLASTYFVSFEVTFLFKSFSLLSKSVFSRKSAISTLVAKSTCAILAAKFSDVNLLNSYVMIYLLL